MKELSEQNKQFENKKDDEKAKIGDQVVFDYSATVDKKIFEGSEGKGVQLELGKDLFLKGSIYEEKIIDLIKSKIKLDIKKINEKEAEKIITEFNKPNLDQENIKKTKSPDKNKAKSKKISKK